MPRRQFFWYRLCWQTHVLWLQRVKRSNCRRSCRYSMCAVCVLHAVLCAKYWIAILFSEVRSSSVRGGRQNKAIRRIQFIHVSIICLSGSLAIRIQITHCFKHSSVNEIHAYYFCVDNFNTDPFHSKNWMPRSWPINTTINTLSNIYHSGYCGLSWLRAALFGHGPKWKTVLSGDKNRATMAAAVSNGTLNSWLQEYSKAKIF